MKKASLNCWETEELVCKIIGLDYDEVDGDTDTIDKALYEELDIDLEQFTEIIRRLLPLIDAGRGMTGDLYKGFAYKKQWLVKMKVSSI